MPAISCECCLTLTSVPNQVPQPQATAQREALAKHLAEALKGTPGSTRDSGCMQGVSKVLHQSLRPNYMKLRHLQQQSVSACPRKPRRKASYPESYTEVIGGLHSYTRCPVQHSRYSILCPNQSPYTRGLNNYQHHGPVFAMQPQVQYHIPQTQTSRSY